MAANTTDIVKSGRGDGAVAPSRPAAPAPVNVKIRKVGPVGAFLRPIGISLALLLAAYGLVSLGTTFWRSYQRDLDYSLATHPDKSIFDIFIKASLPKDAVDLVVRDVDGKLRRVAAAKTDTDNFVNQTILMLDDERDRIKQAAARDIGALFENAFADKEQVLEAYADWFFEWKRSYIVLKETLTSAATRFAQAGEYENLSEAVERDLKDYFMRHYKAQVLKPEVRDVKITQGLETLVRRGHESYRRVIANGDMRLQLFLARNTRNLADIPADEKVTGVTLDWDAQKWKTPTYLMEDRAFDGIAGLGVAAGGGTAGALVLGPVMNRVMARSFGLLSRRFVTTFGARLALAEQGAIAGTLVQPAGGQIVGAIAGVLIGVAADYFINEAQEEFNRDKFIAANREALEATIDTWKTKLRSNVDAAFDRWFDDARASVVLARK
ncbi:MAG TPA: hypothetical protein ENH05_04255 [Rhizobiales bacterium]|nr:hypothetical protein BMS3Bbin10_01422 [bacterium BMS3Bbin10]HDO51932.1 hypothetical protein [Hyphomicrobiales bacterium]